MTSQSPPAAARRPAPHIRARRRQQNALVIVAMSLLVVFLIAMNYAPTLYSIIGSFFDWRPTKRVFEFAGFDNYAHLFSDPLFWQSMQTTVVFAIVTAFFYVTLGLAFAWLIFLMPRFQNFFRSAFFMPVITSTIAVSLVWRYAVYNTDNGIFNTVLGWFGVPAQLWLLNPDQIVGCIIVMTVWKEIGYAILLFLAGFHEVPTTLYEAAALDGATRFQTLRRVALPSLRPTLLLVMVTGMINYMQVFNQVMMMTSGYGTTLGGVERSGFTAMLYIYEQAFTKFNFGYASAAAYCLTAVIMIFTVIQFRLTREREVG